MIKIGIVIFTGIINDIIVNINPKTTKTLPPNLWVLNHISSFDSVSDVLIPIKLFLLHYGR